MSVLRHKKREDIKGKGGALAVQTRRESSMPFYKLNGYIPLKTADCELYDSLREAIPIVDAAIDKIVRLIGGFSVKCHDREAEKYITHFLENIKVGASGYGIDYFVARYLDRLLTWGTAVAEIVPYSNGEIAALYIADNRDISCAEGNNPLNIKLFRLCDGKPIPIRHPDRIIFRALNPMPGSVTGTSILKGLPFVSSVLLKIYSTVGVNFDRIGNVRYAVTYKPSSDGLSIGGDTVGEISEEWSRAMTSSDGVRDFIAVGDVDIKVIGAENAMPEISVPIRNLTEQIVSKLGIPPFMLGLSWSSTERMSQQQADILTSELESYRKLLSSVIYKICCHQLRAVGYSVNPEVVWDDINLQDEVELAKAELYRAQAERLKGESLEKR